MCKSRSISFLSIIEARGWGYPHIKLVYMCRPRLNKKKGGLTELIFKTEKRCLKGDGGGVQTPLKVLGNSKYIGLSLYHV